EKRTAMQQTVLFVPHADYYLVGDPQAPQPWAGDNPDALAALHRIVERRGAWCNVDAFGGSLSHSAMHQRLHNAAKALACVSPLLADELRRGLAGRRDRDDGRIKWRYDRHGALAYIETRPKQTN